MSGRPNKLDLAFVVEDGYCMPVDEPTAKEAMRRLIAKGVTLREISRRVKRPHTTIRNWAHEENFEFQSGKKEAGGATRYETAHQREVRLRIQRATRARRIALRDGSAPPSVP